MTVEERLEKIEAMLAVLVERQTVKDFYEVEEFARLVGRSAFTCREWCRRSRIRAEKRAVAGVPTPHGPFPTRSCSGFSVRGFGLRRAMRHRPSKRATCDCIRVFGNDRQEQEKPTCGGTPGPARFRSRFAAGKAVDAAACSYPPVAR